MKPPIPRGRELISAALRHEAALDVAVVEYAQTGRIGCLVEALELVCFLHKTLIAEMARRGDLSAALPAAQPPKPPAKRHRPKPSSVHAA